jgi:hypothetical protein
VPDGLRPLPALAVNALLGGTHNFDVDRDMAAWARAVWPGYRSLIWAQRAFANRVVRWLAGRGIFQFLDIGCGLPVIGGVHDIAGPDATVVYVDREPMVVTFARELLGERSNVTVVEGDLRRPEGILHADVVMSRLNFDEPIGVLLTGVLPFLADSDDPAGILTRIRSAVVYGSYVAVSHLAPVAEVDRMQCRLRFVYEDAQASIGYRTAQQVAEILDGWELVEPGIVPVGDWHPEPDPDGHPSSKAGVLGAVARAW